MQEKHSAINSAETPLIYNTTLTCLMLRRWTAPLPQNKITKLFFDEKAFEAELDCIQDKVVNQKEILQFSTLCLLYTQELDRNGFPNSDYKSEKKKRIFKAIPFINRLLMSMSNTVVLFSVD